MGMAGNAMTTNQKQDVNQNWGYKNKKDERNGGRVFGKSTSEPMLLTKRDTEIVQWIFSARLATRDQLQRLFFTSGGLSLCKHRLTVLYRHRYIDKLFARPVSAPALYYISRRCTNGLRLLRAVYPEKDIKPRKVASITIRHTLDIADCRIAFIKACAEPTYSFRFWLSEEEVFPHMRASGIIPDAYFPISHQTEDGQKLAGFFIEVERSAKSQIALERKFTCYGRFYYKAEFGTRALRILFLVGSDYGINPMHQIAKYSRMCEHLNVTAIRFAVLDTLLDTDPTRIFDTPIWLRTGTPELQSLFSAGSQRNNEYY